MGARGIARDLAEKDAEQGRGDRQALATDAAEQVVITLVVAPTPQPRSQLVTVRRPRANSSPVQSWTNRACWRASSVPARAVIQTTSETGSHCVSIHGSPSHETVAISNHSMRGEPRHWKSSAVSSTPNEVPDFWESAASGNAKTNTVWSGRISLLMKLKIVRFVTSGQTM